MPQNDIGFRLCKIVSSIIADGFTIAGRLVGNDVAAAYGHHPLNRRQNHNFEMIPRFVALMKLMSVCISTLSGTCSFTWFTASKTDVCPWKMRR